MATLPFSVGTKDHKPVECLADLPKLGEYPDEDPIHVTITLPDGKQMDVRVDSKRELVLAQLTVQLQNAARGVLFPKNGKTPAKAKSERESVW